MTNCIFQVFQSPWEPWCIYSGECVFSDDFIVHRKGMPLDYPFYSFLILTEITMFLDWFSLISSKMHQTSGISNIVNRDPYMVHKNSLK